MFLALPSPFNIETQFDNIRINLFRTPEYPKTAFTVSKMDLVPGFFFKSLHAEWRLDSKLSNCAHTLINICSKP